MSSIEADIETIRQSIAATSDMHPALAALDRLAAAARGREWQDISLAPKVDRDVLVTSPRRTVAIAHYAIGAWWDEFGFQIQPTHFQPLPAPPAKEGA